MMTLRNPAAAASAIAAGPSCGATETSFDKDLNGRVTTKEIMPVLFSVLEGSDQPAFRAS